MVYPFTETLRGGDDEIGSLLREFEVRGIDPSPALALSRSPEELSFNLKARLDPKWGLNPQGLMNALPEVLRKLQFGAQSGAGAVLNAAAEVTGPGPLPSFVPQLREFQNQRDMALAQRQGIDRFGAFGIAEQNTNLPSVNVDVVPGSGINLPGNATLNRVDLGVKGGLELAADPLNFVGTVPKAGKAVKELAESGAGKVAKAGAALEKRGLPSPISQADAVDLTPEQVLEAEVARARKARPAPVQATDPLEAEIAAARGKPPVQPPVAGGTPPVEPTDPIVRLGDVIKNVKKVAPEKRVVMEAQRTQERIARVNTGLSRVRGASPEKAGAAFRSALGGELPSVPNFEPIRGSFTPDDVKQLYGRIWNTDIVRPFERGNVDTALTKLLDPEGLHVPTPSEVVLLEKVFGPEVARSLDDIGKSGLRKTWETTVDVLNFPRAMRSSFDASAVLRQGGVLTIARPGDAFGRDGSFARMVGAMRSQKAFDESLTRIRSDPDFNLLTGTGRDKLFLHDIHETRLGPREEAFMSRLANKVPGVRGSERGYVTYLNEMRFKSAKHFLNDLRAEGIDPAKSERAIQTFNRFLNVSTGRGTLGPIERSKLLQEMAQVPFWSPRLAASRFQLPTELPRAARNLASSDPAMRIASKQIAGDLVKFTGGVMTFISLLDLSGLAEVEADPRSSDFGKIRVGGVRLDLWAGLQQPMRYTAQFITGQRRPITGKGIEPVSGAETAGKFVRSKLAPGAVSIGADFLPKDQILSGLTGGGRTFAGERIVPGTAKPYKTIRDRTKGLDREIYEQVVPLSYYDIQRAIKEQGLTRGLLFGAATELGAGTQTVQEDTKVR